VMALNANVMAALLPYLKEVPEFAGGDFGGVIGAAGLAGAIGAFLLGPLVDLYGRRPPMILGMAVFSLASFAHVWATELSLLLVARAVAGFAAGVVYSAASAAVADLVPYERRGKAMGLFTTGMFLGLPIGLPFAGVCADFGHWEWVYVFQGCVGIGAMFAMRAYLPPGLGKGGAFFEHLPKLATRDVYGALGSVLFYVGSFFTAVQFVGAWLDESGILMKRNQWSVWVVLGLCAAFGSLFLARIGDRIGKRNWTNITCVVVAVCLFGLTFVEGTLGLLLVGIPLAVVSAARTGPFQALISDLVPSDTRGTLMGVRSAAVNLGTGLFPVLATRIAGEDYDTTLYLSSCGVVVALLLVVLLVKKQ
jgi:MFS transporter, DHA1 family, inner membrane transport protein